MSATLFTSGEIARRLGVPSHRVEYFLNTRRIPAKSLAGRYRLYTPDAFRAIEQALSEKRPAPVAMNIEPTIQS